MNLRPSAFALSGLILAAAALLNGCAGPGGAGPAATAPDVSFNDPFENTNRAVFAFNQGVNHTVLIPIAKTYRTVLPDPMRQSFHDFLQNLNGPVIFANDVLQAQLGLAGRTLARFAINTSVGAGGMFDVATRIGIPYHENDFGITLAVWGLPDGPYVVVPVLGPSNPRDLAGQVGDGFADPWNIIASEHHRLWAPVLRSAVSGIDELSRNIEGLNDIERTSLDYYATIRSLYRQRREAQIRHEERNLPNPSPVQGASAAPGADPAMAYSIAEMPRLPEVPPR
ncbi:MAG: VacJ family lipoprotein [Alphaproteobacteria bacterium]|nr:VacJ family lipoprotein [Alphaproteobacteria bacterium]